MSRDLPRGTVTLLFSDIEGSTRLLNELGTARYAEEMAEHRRVLREAFRRHGGVEVDTQGDSFLVAFPTATGAINAARDLHAALIGGRIRVRVGIHSGSPEPTEEGYVGPDVHRGARIAQAAHGGQTLVSAASAALVAAAGLRDLGSHRLRDLAMPEHLFQLGDAEFPPPRTLHQSNLPTPATALVGRQRELAEVAALLNQDAVRLLTLTGAGGTGKTRLALAAAAGARERYTDGVWWVPLAAQRDPALVLESAAQTLAAGAGLAARIADKRMLLVFDNFEQVSAAARDVAALLDECPHLEILVTSRSPLHVTREHEYGVPPLAPGDGTQLFLARARSFGVDLGEDDDTAAQVAAICRRLDDLPLAIELAAARVKVLSVGELLDRLDRILPLLTGGARDLAERQQTLRATITWSHDLLDVGERELFASLAVFRGGWQLRSAQHVTDATVDGLQSLVDHSLVRRRGERYGMLETIREFAAERLAEMPNADETRRRHADHFLALAEEAEPFLFSFSRQWLDRLALEHDNMRAALDRLEARHETQDALRLSGALQRFWIVRGHLAEGRRRLERLLDGDREPTHARGKALNGAALLALNTGEPHRARRLATEALELHGQLGDAWGAARSAFVLGYAHADEGDLELARDLFEQSIDAFRALGDEDNVMFVASNLSWVYRELGDESRSRSIAADNLQRARELGNDSIVALSLSTLALAALDKGDKAGARRMLAEALVIDRKLGDVRRSVDDISQFAHVLAVTGDHTLAGRLLSGAERLHHEIGASISPDIARLNAETWQLLAAALGDERVEQARAMGRQLSFDEAFMLALEEEPRTPAQPEVGPAEGSGS